MAKFIRHDFGAIHEALNKLIIAETKAALELLPEKCIREEGSTLCRIIIGPGCDYSPRNIAVDEVWVDEKDGLLHIYGRDLTHEDCFDKNWADNVEPDEWTEDNDLYDITDFGYLIDQIAEQVEGDETVNLINDGVVDVSVTDCEEDTGTEDEKTVIDKAIDYVREQLEPDELAEIRAQIDRSYRYHMTPGDCVTNKDRVLELLGEYGMDYEDVSEDNAEDWWSPHIDFDDILLKL